MSNEDNAKTTRTGKEKVSALKDTSLSTRRKERRDLYDQNQRFNMARMINNIKDTETEKFKRGGGEAESRVPIIFISHASEDKEHVKWLKEILVLEYNKSNDDKKVTIYFSDNIPGGVESDDDIVDNAKKSSVAILLCSKFTAKKNGVLDEIKIFRENNIEIIPIIILGATVKDIPNSINKKQAKFATRPDELREAFDSINKKIGINKQIPTEKISDYFKKIEPQICCEKKLNTREYDEVMDVKLKKIRDDRPRPPRISGIGPTPPDWAIEATIADKDFRKRNKNLIKKEQRAKKRNTKDAP